MGLMALYILVVLVLFFPDILSLQSLFDKTNLPRLKDTDSIEIYHLRSFPALLIETVAGTFSTQSSGLALRSTTTNQVIVLQYKPKSYSGCFLPIIQASSAQEYNLYWDNRAELVYHDEIDSSYWQQSTFLAHINGIVYKNYVMWLERFMQNNRVYFPQSICNSEHENACYVRSETWDTFLQDSLRVFAAYSVSIHAIIPPRAIELRFLSNVEPLIVQATMNLDEVTPVDGTDPPRRRHDGGKKSGDSSFRRDMSPPSTKRLLRNVEQGGRLHHVLQNSNSSSTVFLKRALDLTEDLKVVNSEIKNNEVKKDTSPTDLLGNSEDSAQSRSSDGKHIQKVAVHEIVNYYQELMSCMQGYQLGDFTNALKSCISSTRKTYVHLSNDYYYIFLPRYPFVYINEYSQDIPNPSYNDTSHLNSLDASILIILLLVTVLGFILTLYKMNMLSCLYSHAQHTSMSKNMDHADYHSYLYDEGEVGVSFVPRTPMKSISRLWGAMGWYRQTKSMFSTSRGQERTGSGQEDEESVELIRYHPS